jgi:transposase
MASLPSVHIPSQVSRDRKMSCGMREGLVASRTKLINTVRGWLRGQTVGLLQKGSSVSFPGRVRKLLEARGCAAPSCVERQLVTIDHLNKQIAAADTDLEALAKNDETCQRLMTVPGVGPLTAVRFLAAIDEVDRFPNAHAVQSYIGLTPGENSSSDRKRNTSITKAGSRQLRWTLVQAAWCAQRTRPSDPMVLWAQAIAVRRGKGIATVALARKLAGILYALWRKGTTYNATYISAASRAVPTE